MPGAEDAAAELLALFNAKGAVNVLNQLGTITSTTVTNVLPDPTVAAYTECTLSGAGIPFQLPAPSQGKTFRLQLVQDTTGSRTAVFTTSAGALTWVGGTPTLTTTGGRSDILSFESYDGINFVGSASLNVH
ncbi:MAG TPA: hypothetical protein VMQ59_06400 [Acidimicrobiales bacterium]|jgi:hypothetical protein|nr:hypothetical protein [Acidimicrobiales bacterium]